MVLPQTHLVEANQADLAAQVDAGRADAEDALFLQPVLGVDGAHGHSGRESRRHDDGDEVEGTDDDLPHRNLEHKGSISGVGTLKPRIGAGSISHVCAGIELLLQPYLVFNQDEDAVQCADKSCVGERMGSVTKPSGEPGFNPSRGIWQCLPTQDSEEQDKLHRVLVELEADGLGVEDGGDEIPFGRAEPCGRGAEGPHAQSHCPEGDGLCPVRRYLCG